MFVQAHGNTIDGVDPSAKDVARLFFRPCIPKGQDFFYEEFHGAQIAVSNYVQGFGSDYQVVKYEPPEEEDFIGRELEVAHTRESVTDALYGIDPSCEYSMWLSVGQALHHWSPTAGFELWDEWSRGSDKYVAEEMPTKWESFNANKETRVTIGTLFHHSNKAVAGLREARVQEIKNMVIQCKNYTDFKISVCPVIRKEASLSDHHYESLPHFIKDHFRKTSAEKISVPTIRNDISRITKGSDSHIPEWAKKWAFVAARGEYFDTEKRVFITTKSFDGMMSGFLPADANTMAHAYVSRNHLAHQVDKDMFMPSCDDAIVTATTNQRRDTVVNTYDPNARPAPLDYEDFTLTDRRAVELLEFHIRALFSEGYHEGAEIFLDWLAFQVQKRGVLRRWCPLIISPAQGIGKSIIGNLLRAVLGTRYVGVLAKNVITTAFNGYAEGKCVNIIEEIRPDTGGKQGHTRAEVYEALKEVLTNDIIQAHRKGIDAYDAPNVTNYLAFTNRLDAIPLSKDDRRFWVHMIGYTAEEFLEYVMPIVTERGLLVEGKDYYESIAHYCHVNASALHTWLMSRELSDDFLRMNRAPNSVAKERMVATEDATNHSEEDKIRDLVRAGAVGVSEKVISTPHLKELVSQTFGEFPEDEGEPFDMSCLSPRRIGRTLRTIGFLSVGSPIRWDDGAGAKQVRVWAATKLVNANQRTLINALNETLEGEF